MSNVYNIWSGEQLPRPNRRTSSRTCLSPLSSSLQRCPALTEYGVDNTYAVLEYIAEHDARLDPHFFEPAKSHEIGGNDTTG